MELRKTRESIRRTFNAEGEANDHVTQIDFDVMDTDGNVVGSAWAQPMQAHLEMNVHGGFESSMQSEAKLREILGIAE